MENPVLWLILPTLNEAENLSWILPELSRIPYQARVIVVDNGSTDASPEVAAVHGAIVVRCGRRGYGSAVQAGMQEAQARARSESVFDRSIMVVFDADGSSPVDAIGATVEPIIRDQAELVIAQRTRLDAGAMPVHARFGNWLQVSLLRFVTGFSYVDMGPLRAMTFGVYEALKMEDSTWGWNIEMQLKAAMLELNITQIGIQYHRRRYGHSKISGSILGSLRAGTRILWSVCVYSRKAKLLVTHKS